MYAGLEYRFGRILVGAEECDCSEQRRAIQREQSLGIQFWNIQTKRPTNCCNSVLQKTTLAILGTKLTYTVDSYSFQTWALIRRDLVFSTPILHSTTFYIMETSQNQKCIFTTRTQY